MGIFDGLCRPQGAERIHTVADLRRAIAGLPGHLPVNGSTYEMQGGSVVVKVGETLDVQVYPPTPDYAKS